MASVARPQSLTVRVRRLALLAFKVVQRSARRCPRDKQASVGQSFGVRACPLSSLCSDPPFVVSVVLRRPLEGPKSSLGPAART